MTLTINIPVVDIVVVVVGAVVIGRCRFQQGFFSQSYRDGQLSLLSSTSHLPILSEHRILSPVTENQWQGENNLYESM